MISIFLPREISSFLKVCSLCILWGAVGLSAGAQEEAGALTSKENEDIFVHKVTKLMDGGKTVDWSGGNSRLLVSKRASSQYHNVYSVSQEGFRLKSLTLSREGSTPRQHNGCGSWHPSGEYFVYTSQNSGTNSYRMSLPGTGLNCNLALGDRDGRRSWPLTTNRTSYTAPKGVVYPYFSPDGAKLLWAGNTGEYPDDSLWGVRALYLADFKMSDGGPSVTNTRELQPGDNKDFYESHGFSPDGNTILFSANLRKVRQGGRERGQNVFGMDIYSYNLVTDKLTALTESNDVWDEFAVFSPDGKKIVWMSSRGQDIPYMGVGSTKWQRFLKSELWIMDSDGRDDPKQLTNFNTPGAVEYVGRRCFIGDCVWSPDGRQIALCLNFESRNFDVESRIVLVELGEGPPVAKKEDPKAAKGKVPGIPGVGQKQPGKRPGRPNIRFRW
ncbi:MAG: hypothetical protein HN742_00975 [Lentisphaerae bacterium]|jgi:Tol biopolymer transport system component|nr:hypothetical protein [Lentisphaerota bacterium]MBT4821489.1 hypothetical protein [Lentisphaerota bacterium]MBT5612385.1 hypothetical protein [Lentisphaerota bacterium]MBT7057756.1 hypothetical protein [Lentisphaerota bacterium]MBT7840405.1 hypothetical protein [Lentisphaerota bacterium]